MEEKYGSQSNSLHESDIGANLPCLVRRSICLLISASCSGLSRLCRDWSRPPCGFPIKSWQRRRKIRSCGLMLSVVVTDLTFLKLQTTHNFLICNQCISLLAFSLHLENITSKRIQNYIWQDLAGSRDISNVDTGQNKLHVSKKDSFFSLYQETWKIRYFRKTHTHTHIYIQREDKFDVWQSLCDWWQLVATIR